ALLLHGDDDAARYMRNADGGLGLVDVLAAGAAGAHGVDLQVGVVDLDVDVLGLGQHRNGGGRGVDAALRFGIGDALHAMHAGLEFHLRESAAAFDHCDDFLV